jgi:26S proteasome regulatory subunit N2
VDVKKDADIEMKSDEPSTTKHGDISPINGSISSLADDGKPSTPSKPLRKTEPSFERLPNFSRVTPAQLAHITFPTDGRYQPVRTVSSKPVPPVRSGKIVVPPAGSSTTSALGLPSEKYAGGGGILILVDQTPDEEAEFIEFETAAIVPAPPEEGIPNGHALAGPPAASGPHIALDEDAPEADPPESFEVSLYDFTSMQCTDHVFVQYPFENDS